MSTLRSGTSRMLDPRNQMADGTEFLRIRWLRRAGASNLVKN